MTAEQARAELKKALELDEGLPADEIIRVLDQYVQATIAEVLEGYQRKPLRFR